MATNPIASTQSLPEPAPLSERQRLAYTFFAPSKIFTDLRWNASWWAPFLIIAIASLLFIYVVDQKVGFRKVVDNLLQSQPARAQSIEQLPPDQRQKVMQQQATWTRILSYATPVFALAIYAIAAGILLATLNFGAGAEVKFSTLFALYIYASLPSIIKALLGIVSLLAGVSVDGFDLQNFVATNPGYFIDANASPVLHALLTPLDVFSLWTLILTAIGITCISKVKRGTAFAIVFGWFGVIVLARVAIAAAFS
jgi:Yip1 domain